MQRFSYHLVIVISILIVACAHVSKEAKDRQVTDLGDAAKSLMANLQYREALGELLKAEKLLPNEKEIQYLLASVYFFGFERHKEAETHIKNAIRFSKEVYPEAENLFGVILLDQNRLEEAIGHLNKASQNLLYTTPYFAEQNLGFALTKMGQLENANQHFKKAIMMQPDLCGAYLPFALNLKTLKQFKEAEHVLENFVAQCDSDRLQKFIPQATLATSYYELGLLKLNLKDKQGANHMFVVCMERFEKEDASKKCKTMLMK